MKTPLDMNYPPLWLLPLAAKCKIRPALVFLSKARIHKTRSYYLE